MFDIGTQYLRENDFICMVSRCCVPLVLRRADGGEHYRLVCGSHTRGLMDEEGLSEEDVKFETVSLG